MKRHLFIISLMALPFMAGCNNNSNILNEANKLLTEKADSVHTCYDAVNLVGDKLAKLKLDDKKEYAYDSVNKKFVIMEGDKIVTKSNGYTPSSDTLDYFKFVTTYNPNSKYSQYLLKEAPAMDALLITTGFDAGTHMDIRNIAYANESRDNRNVLVRAYCDYFSVLAPTQTITHYEDATNVIVTECAKYNEHGESAYMKAVKGEVYVSNDEVCALDMFENAEKNSGDVKLTYEADSKVYGLINYEPVEKHATAYKLNKKSITNGTDLRECMAASTHLESFLRLESDIIYEGTLDSPLSALTVGRPLCIDLNGFKLSFTNFDKGSSNYSEAIRIQSDVVDDKVVDKSLYIIDSQGVLDEHSGISLNNCSIIVAGANKLTSKGEIPVSNLVLNSGKITQTVTNSEKLSDRPVAAAVTVLGQIGATVKKDANFIMYGGKISCVNETSNKTAYGCVGAVGNGSHINVEFGVLESNDFCLYGKENLNGATVNLYGGTLTSSNNTCLYFPSETTVDIQGGKINGLSCITATSGTLSIKNSTKLTATGSGEQYSGRLYDGSVIYVAKDKYDDAELNITVEDSTLTSNLEYIVNVEQAKNSKMTNLNFNSGTYNYMMGEGLLFANSDLVKVNNKQGTWTNTSYK